MRTKKITYPYLLTCILAVLLGGCGKSPESAQTSEGGYQLNTVKGPGVFLASIDDLKSEMEKMRGHVVVVNFWATWCAPCVKEMPELIEFDKEYSEKGVRFLSVSADDPSSLASEVAPYAVKNKLKFAVYVMDGIDEEQIRSELGLDFRAILPTTFVLDKEGKVVKSWIGAMVKSELEEAVTPLL